MSPRSRDRTPARTRARRAQATPQRRTELGSARVSRGVPKRALASMRSYLQPEPEARNDGNTRLIARLAEVVVVDEVFDGRVVVDVLDVEVGGEARALQLPALVDAEVELVKERQALAER